MGPCLAQPISRIVTALSVLRSTLAVSVRHAICFPYVDTGRTMPCAY